MWPEFHTLWPGSAGFSSPCRAQTCTSCPCCGCPHATEPPDGKWQMITVKSQLHICIPNIQSAVCKTTNISFLILNLKKVYGAHFYLGKKQTKSDENNPSQSHLWLTRSICSVFIFFIFLLVGYFPHGRRFQRKIVDCWILFTNTLGFWLGNPIIKTQTNQLSFSKIAYCNF